LANKTRKLSDLEQIQVEMEGAKAEAAQLRRQYESTYNKLRFQSLLSLRRTISTACGPDTFKSFKTLAAKSFKDCLKLSSNDLAVLNADDQAAVAKALAGLANSLTKQVVPEIQKSKVQHQDIVERRSKAEAGYKRQIEVRVPSNLGTQCEHWIGERGYVSGMARANFDNAHRDMVVFESEATRKMRDSVDAAAAEVVRAPFSCRAAITLKATISSPPDLGLWSGGRRVHTRRSAAGRRIGAMRAVHHIALSVAVRVARLADIAAPGPLDKPPAAVATCLRRPTWGGRTPGVDFS
jgi:hypothetical protein